MPVGFQQNALKRNEVFPGVFIPPGEVSYFGLAI